MAKNKLPPIVIVVIVSVITLIFTLLALLAFVYYDRQPRDLGSQMEYIGKNDSGCLIICDASPASRLFFATDLTKEEVKKYFGSAVYIEAETPSKGYGSSFEYEFLDFRTGGSSFVVHFYDDKQGIIDAFDLPSTSKEYVVSLYDDSYHIARRHVE